MKKFLNIDESEKSRILEMHQNAIKNHYLSEQSQSELNKTINGKIYKLEGITDETSLKSFTGDREYTEQDLAYLNGILGTQFKMMSSDGKSSGLGKKALSAVQDGLEFIAQKVQSKQDVCKANFTVDQFKSIPSINDIQKDITSNKKISDVINQRIKTSEYCKRV